MKIKLGPLLGIEADYRYTVCFLSESKLKKNSLTLELSKVDTADIFRYEYESCTKLQSHYFYRFGFDAPIEESAYQLFYSFKLNGKSLPDAHDRQLWEFEVPGRDKMPKIAFASCNGDSKKHPSKIAKKEFLMWKQMRKNHLNPGERFHLLLMGGDQIYADSVWDQVPIIDRLKVRSKLTTDIVVNTKFSASEMKQLTSELGDFYEQLYIDSWNNIDMSFMLASVPSVMMWDDHDIVDGWGSYEPKLQNSELFRSIFPVAKKYFEIFQHRTDANTSRVSKRHFSSHFGFRNFEIVALDNRTFRTMKQVMAPSQYNDLDKVLARNLFAHIPHAISNERVLCFLIPVPVAHLNYSEFIEKFLSKISKNDFRNSMNDDAVDHWDHKNHSAEQKELLDRLFDAGNTHNAKYVCVVSGDVHIAGAATITDTHSKHKITQIISSGLIHRGPRKWQEVFLKLASYSKSKVAGYELDLKNFGSFKKNAVNLRNFGILTKAPHSGIVASLELEKRENLAHRTLNRFKP
ncbi:MAG: alkaline phosphatase D family protein [Pseudohongiellaceae bacterium]